MELAMIGLGRMGANMAQRLRDAGHDVVGYDPSDKARAELATAGGKPVDSDLLRFVLVGDPNNPNGGALSRFRCEGAAVRAARGWGLLR